MRQVHRLQDLKTCSLQAEDGEIGSVQQIYFEDTEWDVRYLVVRTGSWLLGRHVLIAPRVVKDVDTDSARIAVDLTQEQIKNSPPLDTEKPVSRQYEEQFHRFYGWAPYWSGVGLGGAPLMTPPISPAPPERAEPPQTHLRSSDEVTGYHVATKDGRLGHMEDLLIDDENWKVRYIEVDTGDWWPGKKVLIAPTWIESIHLEGSEIAVSLTREVVRNAPEYDPSAIVTPDYEIELFEYYSRAAQQT